jgi:high-affinity iron transporter
MFTTFSFAFREYLEVFLIIGVFYGISQKLAPKAVNYIKKASLLGVSIALLLPVLFFSIGTNIKQIITSANQELFEGFVMVASALLLAYVVISLHSFFNKHRSKTILETHKKLTEEVYDKTLFATIVLLIAREGLEIGLFTASTSLLTSFSYNMFGLLLGFVCAAIIGYAFNTALLRASVSRLFVFTQWVILVQGAALLQRGVAKLLEAFGIIDIAAVGSFALQFMPNDETFIGELIKAFTGLTPEYSVAKLCITLGYVAIVSLLLKTYYAKTE